MNDLLLFLIKVSAGTLFMYMLFIIFYRNDTFYQRNRIFLLMSLMLPVIFPLMKISFDHGGKITPLYGVFESFAIAGNSFTGAQTERAGSFSILRFLFLIWLVISVLLIIKTLISIIRTMSIIRKGTLVRNGFPKLILTSGVNQPFSFFPYAVIPDTIYKKDDSEEVIRHEFVHIKQMHTFDLMLTELFTAFFWFNPVTWMIKRSVILNHEYLADDKTVKASIDSRNYQYMLLNIQSGFRNIPVANNFNTLIKKRIIMINKKPTPAAASLKNIFILPVAAILFMTFSFSPAPSAAISSFQEPLFSKESNVKILKFLAENMKYPMESKSSLDTGKLFVIVKMGKGGKVEECKAASGPGEISVPILQEIVVVAYIPPVPQHPVAGSSKAALKAECIRVAEMLGSCDIPEWKDKDIKFAVPVKFVLK